MEVVELLRNVFPRSLILMNYLQSWTEMADARIPAAPLAHPWRPQTPTRLGFRNRSQTIPRSLAARRPTWAAWTRPGRGGRTRPQDSLRKTLERQTSDF